MKITLVTMRPKFDAGEISPDMYALADLDRYKKGIAEINSFIRMRPTFWQRIKNWFRPNKFKDWKYTQETETYISPKVSDESFW